MEIGRWSYVAITVSSGAYSSHRRIRMLRLKVMVSKPWNWGD